MSTTRRELNRGCRRTTAARTRVTAVMLIGLSVFSAPAASAQDSTQPLLGAVKIEDTLWIQQTTAGLDYAINDNAREFLTLRPGVTFVAPGEVKLAWKGFNPLAVAVSASETSTPDPNFAQLTQFLDTLAKLPDLISKPQSGPFAACPQVGQTVDLLDRLRNGLNAGQGLPSDLARWRKLLSDQPGRNSVITVQEEMATGVQAIRLGVKNARDSWALLGDLATKMVAEVTLAQQKALAAKTLAEKAEVEKALAKQLAADKSAAGKAAAEKMAAAAKEDAAKAEAMKAEAARVEAAKTAAARAAGDPGEGTGVPLPKGSGTGSTAPGSTATGQTLAETSLCQDASIVVGLIAESLKVTEVVNRIELLERLAGDLDKTRSSLDPFVKGVWVDDSYVFYRATASAKDIKTITVKVVPLSASIVSGALVRTSDNDKAVSVAFNLRQHSNVVTEVVPGFVVASVTAPQYETGLDANGKTVIVRGKDKDVSFGGALLLNGILGANRKSFLYPMVQVGVSVSTDGPGVLAGIGGRFSGSRALAFSAGGVLAWVKDLQTLAPGSPVGSKNDIKADLGYEPTVKWYFALQYNFK